MPLCVAAAGFLSAARQMRLRPRQCRSTAAAKSESGQIEIRRNKRHRKRQSLKPFHRHRCTNNSQKNAVHSKPFFLRSAYRLHQVTPGIGLLAGRLRSPPFITHNSSLAQSRATISYIFPLSAPRSSPTSIGNTFSVSTERNVSEKKLYFGL